MFGGTLIANCRNREFFLILIVGIGTWEYGIYCLKCLDKIIGHVNMISMTNLRAPSHYMSGWFNWVNKLDSPNKRNYKLIKLFIAFKF